MGNPLLQIPASACVLLLALHAWTRRGPLFTIAYFFLGTIFFYEKERSTLIEERNYVVSEMALAVGGVPVILIVGWLFTCYVALSLAERIIAYRVPSKRGRFFPTFALVLLAIGCTAVAMEVTGSKAGWWVWNETTVTGTSPELPIRTFFLWQQVAMNFFLPFLLLFTDNSLSTRLPAWGRVVAMLVVMATWTQVYPLIVSVLHVGVFLLPIAFWFVPWVRFVDGPAAGSTAIASRSKRHSPAADPT